MALAEVTQVIFSMIPWMIFCQVHFFSNINPAVDLFLNSRALKLLDLVEYQNAQIMYKARKKVLPCNIQKLLLIEKGFII